MRKLFTILFILMTILVTLVVNMEDDEVHIITSKDTSEYGHRLHLIDEEGHSITVYVSPEDFEKYQVGRKYYRKKSNYNGKNNRI